jgi:hypothetical protein
VDLPSRIGGAEYWRNKAEEARVMAEGFRDPASRLAMFEVATHFESIAARVESLRAHLRLVEEDERKGG